MGKSSVVGRPRGKTPTSTQKIDSDNLRNKMNAFVEKLQREYRLTVKGIAVLCGELNESDPNGKRKYQQFIASLSGKGLCAPSWLDRLEEKFPWLVEGNPSYEDLTEEAEALRQELNEVKAQMFDINSAYIKKDRQTSKVIELNMDMQERINKLTALVTKYKKEAGAYS